MSIINIIVGIIGASMALEIILFCLGLLTYIVFTFLTRKGK